MGQNFRSQVTHLDRGQSLHQVAHVYFDIYERTPYKGWFLKLGREEGEGSFVKQTEEEYLRDKLLFLKKKKKRGRISTGYTHTDN